MTLSNPSCPTSDFRLFGHLILAACATRAAVSRLAPRTQLPKRQKLPLTLAARAPRGRRRACTAAGLVSRGRQWSAGRVGACAAWLAAHAGLVALGAAGSLGKSCGSASQTPAPSLRRSARRGCAGARTWTASGLRAVLHGQRRRAPAAGVAHVLRDVSAADAARCERHGPRARLPGVQWYLVRALRVRKDG
jgi:hypothetical protein